MPSLLRTLITSSRPILRSQIHPTPSLRILRPASTMQHSVPPLNDKSLLKDKTYINGQWVGASSGQTFEVHDPASGLVIGTQPEMDSSDVETAIKAAEAALPSFRKTTGRERSKMLRKWYDLMMENAEDLARLITWENVSKT